jgi:hypothetical protein
MKKIGMGKHSKIFFCERKDLHSDKKVCVKLIEQKEKELFFLECRISQFLRKFAVLYFGYFFK